MKYTFELIGISPVLSFFNYQYERQFDNQQKRAQYLATHRCTLDAFLDSAKIVSPEQGWQLDRVVDTIINFWLNNADQVRHWRHRLEDAGKENLLVGRVADFEALKSEFEFLLRQDGSP
jgi:plasmid maintenance system antidote protein VapI